MRRPAVDWRLYLVTDPILCAPRSVVEVVQAAVCGGVTVVQLRDKHATARDLMAQAQQLKKWLSPRGVPLIINDRVDLAWACHADGVHLGQTDVPVQQAREWLGPHALIGLSVENKDQILAANKQPVDYLGIGPVFQTSTKMDTHAPWGLQGIRAIRKLTQQTLVGIGGIHIENVHSVVQAGVDGVAVVSAICSSSEPMMAARALCWAINDK